MRQRQTDQSGSVAAFLVVGIVLAGLVIGGVYMAHQRGESARSGDTSAPVAVHQDKKTNNQSSKNTSDTGNEQAAKQQREKEQVAEQKRQEEARAQAEEKAKQEKAKEEEAKRLTQSTAPTSTAQTPAMTIPQTGRTTTPEAVVGQLPATGPMDTTLQVLAGAILAGGVIAYLRSYRSRFGSLFR